VPEIIVRVGAEAQILGINIQVEVLVVIIVIVQDICQTMVEVIHLFMVLGTELHHVQGEGTVLQAVRRRPLVLELPHGSMNIVAVHHLRRIQHTYVVLKLDLRQHHIDLKDKIPQDLRRMKNLHQDRDESGRRMCTV
jgi:hypothetical protein